MSTKQKKPKAGIVQRAVKAAGGATAVGEKMEPKRHRQSVWGWIRRNSVPADDVPALCKMTGGLFQPHDLRPDVYGEDQRVQVTV